MRTEARILYDAENLYVAFTCHEPNIAGLVYKRVPRDNSDAFRGDCVELMIDPGRSGSGRHWLYRADQRPG